jgi:hypothetical protein
MAEKTIKQGPKTAQDSNGKETIRDMGKGGQDTLKPMQIETKNTAKPGDWIVMAASGAAEEAPTWVVLEKKFPKFYDTVAGEAHPTKSGYACYNVKPEQRTGIVVTNETLLLAKHEFGEKTPSQDEFFDFVVRKIASGEIETVTVRKVDRIYAKQVKPEDGEVEVITRVKAGNEPQFNFTAIWGEVMPVAVDDVLIYLPAAEKEKGEVYRIARAEFERTYVFSPTQRSEKVQKELTRLWRTLEFPETYIGYEEYEEYYVDLLHTLQGLKTLKYTPEDVERFSITVAKFQEERDFDEKAGIFLSCLINWGRGMDYTIHTHYYKMPINHLGYKNLKNVTIRGNAGDDCGQQMLRGTINVEGDAGEWVGGNLAGGTIVVKGNAGNYIAESTFGGEIRLEGDYGDIQQTAQGVRIYHKGRLIVDPSADVSEAPTDASGKTLDDILYPAAIRLAKEEGASDRLGAESLVSRWNREAWASVEDSAVNDAWADVREGESGDEAEKRHRANGGKMHKIIDLARQLEKSGSTISPPEATTLVKKMRSLAEKVEIPRSRERAFEIVRWAAGAALAMEGEVRPAVHSELMELSKAGLPK